MTDEAYPVPAEPRTPDAGVREPWVRRVGLGYLLQEAIGAVPPLAALGLAGYYQTEIAHDVLHFGYPWAVVPAAAIEGGAAYCAVLYDRHLVAGDSTIPLRLGMLGYAAGSSALLAWHAHSTGKPWQISVALGLLTLSAMFLWGRRGKWRKRALLRDKGLLDAQVVRFSVPRWIAAPLETPAALRYAVKHSIADPRTAIEAWRTHRADVRSGRLGEQKVRRERARPATPDAGTPDEPVPAEVRTPRPRRTQPGTSEAKVRPISSVSEDDAAVLVRLRAAEQRKGDRLTLDEVGHIAGGSRPRAVRLRRLMEQADRTPTEGEPDDAKEDQREPVSVGTG